MEANCGKVDVLPWGSSVDYLGRRLNLARLHDTELEHRLEKGWKKFFANKADLCGKHAALSVRLKLFNAIITPTVLYGSASWTRGSGC